MFARLGNVCFDDDDGDGQIVDGGAEGKVGWDV